MNFILYLLIVACLCTFEAVNSRSVQTDSDSADKDGNHDTESGGGIFSWIRLKPLLRREVQRISNVKGETNKFNQAEIESLAPSKENENLPNENEVSDTNEKNSLKPEPLITNISIIKSELIEHNHNEDPNIESNKTGEFISNATDVQMHEMDHPSVANDFPDNVISDILNQSSDSIFLQAMNDNSSNIDSIEFDETSLLSEGGHIAMLQEVSTVGFELLIDSETKQNSILAELLNSQSNLIDDDNSFVTMQFNDSNENKLQEIITDIKETNNPDVESRPDEEKIGNNEFGSDDGKIEKIESNSDENKTGDTEFNSDVGKTESSEFGSDEDKIGDTEFGSDEDEIKDDEFGSEEGKTEGSEFGSDEDKTGGGEFDSDEGMTENIDFDTGEIKIVHNGSDLSDSVQVEKVTTEPEDPRCPDPGWCIFWFMAIDLCAKDSHCHGSLLCCTIGCSKTCIDADNVHMI